MAALEFHELAGLFPMMDGVDPNALAVDILENGLREPIVLFEEKILDGRNRYNACIATGVAPTFRPYLGDDPTGFVVSLNYHRRHLNAGQRALFAEELTTIGHGGDRRSDQVAIGKITQAAAAKIAKVSPRSVAAAKALKRDAVPDVVEAVERGIVPIAEAAAFAKQVPTLEQARLIEEHGSPADAVKASKLAVKAKADRAANKTPKPVPPVKPAADRAEQTAIARSGDNPPTAAEARAAHLHYDAATRTLDQLKKVAAAFVLVRGAVPDPQISKGLAAYAEAVELIRFTIANITDPERTYEPCDLNEEINSAAERDEKFRDALNLTGFER